MTDTKKNEDGGAGIRTQRAVAYSTVVLLLSQAPAGSQPRAPKVEVYEHHKCSNRQMI
jgi:hypothetical protein